MDDSVLCRLEVETNLAAKVTKSRKSVSLAESVMVGATAVSRSSFSCALPCEVLHLFGDPYMSCLHRKCEEENW